MQRRLTFSTRNMPNENKDLFGESADHNSFSTLLRRPTISYRQGGQSISPSALEKINSAANKQHNGTASNISEISASILDKISQGTRQKYHETMNRMTELKKNLQSGASIADMSSLEGIEEQQSKSKLIIEEDPHLKQLKRKKMLKHSSSSDFKAFNFFMGGNKQKNKNQGDQGSQFFEEKSQKSGMSKDPLPPSRLNPVFRRDGGKSQTIYQKKSNFGVDQVRPTIYEEVDDDCSSYTRSKRKSSAGESMVEMGAKTQQQILRRKTFFQPTSTPPILGSSPERSRYTISRKQSIQSGKKSLKSSKKSQVSFKKGEQSSRQRTATQSFLEDLMGQREKESSEMQVDEDKIPLVITEEYEIPQKGRQGDLTGKYTSSQNDFMTSPKNQIPTWQQGLTAFLSPHLMEPTGVGLHNYKKLRTQRTKIWQANDSIEKSPPHAQQTNNRRTQQNRNMTAASGQISNEVKKSQRKYVQSVLVGDSEEDFGRGNKINIEMKRVDTRSDGDNTKDDIINTDSDMSQFDHLEVLVGAKPPKMAQLSHNTLPQENLSSSDSFGTDASFALKSDHNSQKSRERNEVAELRVQKWRLTKEYGYLCDKVRQQIEDAIRAQKYSEFSLWLTEFTEVASKMQREFFTSSRKPFFEVAWEQLQERMKMQKLNSRKRDNFSKQASPRSVYAQRRLRHTTAHGRVLRTTDFSPLKAQQNRRFGSNPRSFGFKEHQRFTFRQTFSKSKRFGDNPTPIHNQSKGITTRSKSSKRTSLGFSKPRENENISPLNQHFLQVNKQFGSAREFSPLGQGYQYPPLKKKMSTIMEAQDRETERGRARRTGTQGLTTFSNNSREILTTRNEPNSNNKVVLGGGKTQGFATAMRQRESSNKGNNTNSQERKEERKAPELVVSDEDIMSNTSGRDEDNTKQSQHSSSVINLDLHLVGVQDSITLLPTAADEKTHQQKGILKQQGITITQQSLDKSLTESEISRVSKTQKRNETNTHESKDAQKQKSIQTPSVEKINIVNDQSQSVKINLKSLESSPFQHNHKSDSQTQLVTDETHREMFQGYILRPTDQKPQFATQQTSRLEHRRLVALKSNENGVAQKAHFRLPKKFMNKIAKQIDMKKQKEFKQKENKEEKQRQNSRKSSKQRTTIMANELVAPLNRQIRKIKSNIILQKKGRTPQMLEDLILDLKEHKQNPEDLTSKQPKKLYVDSHFGQNKAKKSSFLKNLEKNTESGHSRNQKQQDCKLKTMQSLKQLTSHVMQKPITNEDQSVQGFAMTASTKGFSTVRSSVDIPFVDPTISYVLSMQAKRPSQQSRKLKLQRTTTKTRSDMPSESVNPELNQEQDEQPEINKIPAHRLRIFSADQGKRNQRSRNQMPKSLAKLGGSQTKFDPQKTRVKKYFGRSTSEVLFKDSYMAPLPKTSTETNLTLNGRETTGTAPSEMQKRLSLNSRKLTARKPLAGALNINLRPQSGSTNFTSPGHQTEKPSNQAGMPPVMINNFRGASRQERTRQSTKIGEISRGEQQRQMMQTQVVQKKDHFGKDGFRTQQPWTRKPQSSQSSANLNRLASSRVGKSKDKEKIESEDKLEKERRAKRLKVNDKFLKRMRTPTTQDQFSAKLISFSEYTEAKMDGQREQDVHKHVIDSAEEQK